MRLKIILSCLFIYISALYGQPDKNYPGNTKSYQEITNEDFEYEFSCYNSKLMSSKFALDSVTYYQIKEDTSIYIGKGIHLYNANNELITTEIYETDVRSFGMSTVYTENYIYNSDNKIEQIDFFAYYGDFSNSAGITKGEEVVERLSYNKEGLIIKKEVFDWNPRPNGEEKEYFTYNEDGFLNNYTYIAYIEWPIPGWDTITKEMYIYPDTTENMKVTIAFRWDDITLEWLNDKKTITALNSAGYRSLWIDYLWNMEKNAWQDYMKEEITYGQQNQVLTKTIYTYDSRDKRWVGIRKKEFEYNTDGDIKNINYYNSDYFYETWYLDGKDLYHYSDKVTNINQNLYSSCKIQIYPNPADNWLTICFESNATGEYSIFNIHSQLCLSGKLNNLSEKIIDISVLDNGVYIIQIQIKDTGVQVFKLYKR